MCREPNNSSFDCSQSRNTMCPVLCSALCSGAQEVTVLYVATDRVVCAPRAGDSGTTLHVPVTVAASKASAATPALQGRPGRIRNGSRLELLAEGPDGRRWVDVADAIAAIRMISIQIPGHAAIELMVK